MDSAARGANSARPDSVNFRKRGSLECRG
jgi:hypothetical protein